MHVSSGRWLLGLGLTLLTAFLWGILPIKLKQVLQVMDPLTVTWYRMLVAGVLLGGFLAARGELPRLGRLKGRERGVLAVCVLGLGGNYVLFLSGLNMVSPGTAQLVTQIAPIMLLLASLLVFRERFTLLQGLGLTVLLLGFGLFFNQRLGELFGSFGRYTLGVLVVFAGAVVWTFYGLAQKQMLAKLSSMQVMVVIYLSCAVLLTPWVHPLEALQLSPLQGWLLLACCLNTLVAYGAFAEALAHWEASKVSASLAMTPLVTLASVALVEYLWPGTVGAESLNLLAYGGAALVAFGSATVAVGPALLRNWMARRAPLQG